MIHMICSGCGAKLKAPDHAAGRTIPCPKCGTSIVVSEPVYDAEAVADPFAAPDDVYGLEDPVLDAPSSSEEKRRPCPMCGEMIVASAAKCRFCGEVFDPTLKKAEAKKSRKSRGGGDDEDMSTGDWVVALLCSGIGCIAGIVWMIQGKPKGKKMFLVSFVMQIAWGVVRVALQEAAKNQ